MVHRGTVPSLKKVFLKSQYIHIYNFFLVYYKIYVFFPLLLGGGERREKLSRVADVSIMNTSASGQTEKN